MSGFGLRRRLVRALPWIAVSLLALAALAPALLAPGIVATRAAGDSPFNLLRVHQMALAINDMHLPPRWMPDAAYGLGYPFWNYYAPLVYLWAGLIAALGGGVVGAIKVSQALCFLAAGWGAYRLARDTWRSHAAGLLAAASYTFAPYHMVNVYARGDAMAELAAYALFPWVLVAVDAVAARPTPRRAAGLATAIALLLLAHNISAVLFLPVLLAYALWRGLTRTPSLAWPSGPPPEAEGVTSVGGARLAPSARYGAEARSWVATLETSLARLEWRMWPWLATLRFRPFVLGACMMLGAALAAWFWLPALAEREAVQLGASTTGYFDYRNHFLGFELLQLDLTPDYDAEAGAPAFTGLLQALLALAGFALVTFGLRREGAAAHAAGAPKDAGRAVAFWATVALITTLMMTALSAPIWRVAPLIAYAQFPWRWLSVQALALAMLAAPLAPALAAWATGGLTDPVGEREDPYGRREQRSSALGRAPRPVLVAWLVAAVCATALTAGSMLALTPEIITVAPPSRGDVQAFELLSGSIGSTVRGEYLPAAVEPRPYTSVDVTLGRDGDPRALSGTLQSATLLRHEVDMQEWQIEIGGPDDAELAFPTFAFPGWHYALDEGVPKEAGAEAGSGWLVVEAPPGAHTLRLWLGRSTLRAMSELLSVAAMLVLVALWLTERGRGWRALGAVGLCLALSVLAARFVPTGLGAIDTESPPLTVLDWPLAPWPHIPVDGVDFDGTRLTGINTSADEGPVKAGGSLLVSPAWSQRDDDRALEVALVSPAAAIFGVPDVLAVLTEPLADAQSLVLEVPEATGPGAYFLRMRMLDEDGDEIPAESAGGRALGPVYIGPIRVRAPSDLDASPPDEEPVLRAPGIALHDVELSREGDQLLVSMTWWPDTTPERDFKVSLRLLDPASEPEDPAETAGDPSDEDPEHLRDEAAGVQDPTPLVQDDKAPLYGFSPPTTWAPARPVRDRRWIDLPADLPTGTYDLRIVVYDPAGGEEIARGLVTRQRLRSRRTD